MTGALVRREAIEMEGRRWRERERERERRGVETERGCCWCDWGISEERSYRGKEGDGEREREREKGSGDRERVLLV